MAIKLLGSANGGEGEEVWLLGLGVPKDAREVRLGFMLGVLDEWAWAWFGMGLGLVLGELSLSLGLGLVWLGLWMLR